MQVHGEGSTRKTISELKGERLDRNDLTRSGNFFSRTRASSNSSVIKRRPPEVPRAVSVDRHRLLMRVLVSRFRVLIGLLAVLLSTHRVPLPFFMITVVMMVGRLVMVMSRSLVFGSRIVMMVTRPVLFLVRHEKLLTRDLRLDALRCIRKSRHECSAATSSSAFGAKGAFQ
jgi:hypothetical protein